jgi:transcriptional regulator with XRE-family HTH domain
MRLNQRDLAAKLGVKQQTVSRWESGIALPRPDRVTQLAAALGMERVRLLRLAGYLTDDDQLDDAPLPGMLNRVSRLSDDDLLSLLDAAWDEHKTRKALDGAAAPPWRGNTNGNGSS